MQPDPSPQLLDQIIERSPIGIALIDFGGHYRKVNAAYCRLYGYRADELLAGSFLMVFPLLQRELTLARHQQFLTRGGELRGERDVVRRDGSALSVITESVRLPGPDGRGQRLVYVVDITGRKAMERALRSSQQFLQAVLDGLSAHVCVLDERGNIAAVNRAWHDFAAGSPLATVGEGDNYLQACRSANANQAPALPHDEHFVRQLGEVLTGQREGFEFEYSCRADALDGWFVARVSRIAYHDEPRTVVAHDSVTDLKRAQETASAADRVNARRRFRRRRCARMASPSSPRSPTMLINCVAYQDGKRLADIAVEDIDQYVGRPDCFVWVALRDASEDELSQMQHEFGLHDLAVEDARHGHQRPKVEEYGDTLFAVIQTIEPDPLDRLQVGEVHVFVGANFVLSIRNRSHQSLLGVRERAEREPHLLRHGAGFVLYAVMDAIVDRYFPIIDAMESELEGIEAQIFERGAARSNIEQLYDLKQRIMTVRHAVAPLGEATFKLWSGRVPAVCEGTREYYRDVYDHLMRILATLDGLRETIGTAIQVNLSMVTIEESETTKRLAAWAGIFAVATAFAGIWGMNFEVMPELKWRYGYVLALGLIGGVSGLLYWRFRRAGWL